MKNYQCKKGVCLLKNGTYRAQLHYEGKTYYLGRYFTEEDAHEAYKMKFRQIHGVEYVETPRDIKRNQTKVINKSTCSKRVEKVRHKQQIVSKLKKDEIKEMRKRFRGYKILFQKFGFVLLKKW